VYIVDSRHLKKAKTTLVGHAHGAALGLHPPSLGEGEVQSSRIKVWADFKVELSKQKSGFISKQRIRVKFAKSIIFFRRKLRNLTRRQFEVPEQNSGVLILESTPSSDGGSCSEWPDPPNRAPVHLHTSEASQWRAPIGAPVLFGGQFS